MYQYRTKVSDEDKDMVKRKQQALTAYIFSNEYSGKKKCYQTTHK